MPSPQTLYLEFDKTGILSDNLIELEQHSTPSTTNRLIIPKYGAFYRNSLRVYSVNDSNQTYELVKDVDYVATEILHKATAIVGQEVSTVVLVTEPTIRNNFTITYQALGGSDQIHREKLLALLDIIQTPTGTVDFKDIQAKPKGYYPSAHLHDSIDIYGLEYIRDAIGRLDTAIAITDLQTHNALIKRIDERKSDILALNADNINAVSETVMTIVHNVENSLEFTSENVFKLNDHLEDFNTSVSDLKEEVLDYKFMSYNDTLANTANLLRKRNYDNSTTQIDIPRAIAQDNITIYLKSINYNESNGIWSDVLPSNSTYTGDNATKPSRVASGVNPALEAVRFTTGKYLSKTSTVPFNIQGDRTVFVVAAPVPGTDYIKLDLFNDAQSRLGIDTAEHNAIEFSSLDGSTIHYQGKISDKLADAPTVIVSTISNRAKECITLNNSPYKVGLVSEGVVRSTLNTLSSTVNTNRIASVSKEQSADVFMVLVFNRILSKAEIHSVLTDIRIEYDTSVSCIENGDFKNWDIGYGADTEAIIDFSTRGRFGCAAVTDLPIALWDSTNTYSQPGYTLPTDIKIDTNPYLLVLCKNEIMAFWRQTMDLDVGCRYELKFSIVYGQESLPSIQLKVNRQNVGSVVSLNPVNSLLRDYVISFTPSIKTNVFELFNLNISRTGNCFGIGAMSLQRKIYPD